MQRSNGNIHRRHHFAQDRLPTFGGIPFHKKSPFRPQEVLIGRGDNYADSGGYIPATTRIQAARVNLPLQAYIDRELTFVRSVILFCNDKQFVSHESTMQEFD